MIQNLRASSVSRRVAAVTLGASLVLAGEQVVRTCASPPERAVFAHVPHPDFPLARFAAGELGVLQPTYARSYLVVAYRYLSGRPLTGMEQDASVALWRDRLGLADASDGRTNVAPIPTAVERWIARRRNESRLPAMDRLDIFRRVTPGGYTYYENCLPDAFDRAARTADRLARSAIVTAAAQDDWWRAQDAVFANCGGGDTAASAPPATTFWALQADRTYQSAAAAFYRGEFDRAAEAFRQIATDPSSPWRTYGRYLAARATLREATLVAGEGQFDRSMLEAAEREFAAVTQDPALAALHTSAAGLRAFARARLEPEARRLELSAALVSGRAEATWRADLGDYTWLLDRRPGDVDPGDDLSRWIGAWQTPDPSSIDTALARWSSTRSLPWLIVALAAAPDGEARTADLRAAAATVPTSSPAFPTVAYHAARLAEATGDAVTTRRELDRVITDIGPRLPRSALNRFLARRMRVAVNFEEWLSYALRVPTMGTIDIDGMERPELDSRYSRVAQAPGQSYFDEDSTRVMNEVLPLSRLIDAARSPALPVRLRRDIARAAWTRIWLLQDRSSAEAFTPDVRQLLPELARVAAPNDANALETLVAVLRHPGLQPDIDSGLGREPAVGRLDNFRDNWWCAAPTTPTGVAPGPAPFLSPAEREAAAAERAALDRLGTAPNYLASEAVRLARMRPEDPRAPEALHLAVRATRFGCTDPGTGGASRTAFQLLHGRYPGSEWATMTPFWFK